ncbi:MAG: hypothetical protein FWG39_02025 [Alphaproteobacteria bacterium]|nr:hypothetical protein [Alphaproteobacteria bacterium]
MPYSIAVLNFFVQFSIWIPLFILEVTITNDVRITNPLYFLLSVIAVHSILMIFSKREPQLANIIAAKIQLFRKNIPESLVV